MKYSTKDSCGLRQRSWVPEGPKRTIEEKYDVVPLRDLSMDHVSITSEINEKERVHIDRVRRIPGYRFFKDKVSKKDPKIDKIRLPI